jgi:3-hydroxyacyl-CoA dehydrogenase
VEEGIALRASDVDVTYIHGYGFPRYRGGLMFYGDTVGPKTVYDAMLKLQAEDDAMVPSSLLAKLAKEGGSFTGQF